MPPTLCNPPGYCLEVHSEIVFLQFTIRIIKKFESVSEEEAIRRLDHKKD